MISCTFKEKSGSLPASSSIPIGPLSPGVSTAKLGQIHLSWVQENEQSHVYKRKLVPHSNKQSLTHAEPLILNATVPDEAKLSLSSYSKDLSVVTRVAAEGSISDSNGVSVTLDTWDLNFKPANGNVRPHLELNLRGMAHLLSADRESSAFIKLRLYDSNNLEIEHFEMTLFTPPSHVQIEQVPLAQFEASHPPIHTNLKTLRTLRDRIELLQVLKISNRSPLPVLVDLPVQPQGTLSFHVTETAIHPERCSYTARTEEREDILSERLFLIPLEENMPARFSDFIIQSIMDQKFSVSLLSGEEKLVGLYAEGPEVIDLLATPFASQSVRHENVVASCTAVCPDTGPAWDSERTPTLHWMGLGSPGHSHSCALQSQRRGGNDRGNHIGSLCRFPSEQQQSPAQCLECALWETSNGTSPSDPLRFCRSDSGVEKWNITPTPQTIEVGTRRGPVYLKLHPEFTSARIRFKTQNEAEESPSRLFPHFLMAESIQTQ